MLAIVPRPIDVGQSAPVMNTHSCFMRVVPITFKKTNVVTCDDSHVFLSGHLQAAPDNVFFARASRPNQLQIEAIAKNSQPIFQRIGCQCIIPTDHRSTNIAFSTARQGQQSIAGICRKPFAPGHRLAANLAFQVGARDQLGEIPIAVIVLHEQQQREWMVGIFIISDTKIESDDRLDACGNRLAIELHETEQVILIGQCNSRHGFTTTTGNQPGNSNRAVHHRVLGVHVKMYELGAHRDAAFTGANVCRCSRQGPNSRSLSRCNSVP